jgi:hypothetical protein
VATPANVGVSVAMSNVTVGKKFRTSEASTAFGKNWMFSISNV